MLHDVADRELENLVEMLWGEASGGGSLGPMFVEGLSLALLGLVNSRYSQRQPQGRAEPGKLSPRDAKRVRAAIEAQLGDSLSIEKLAELLSMSPYYFSRTFKATFGQSPHAFVLDQRVDAACRALRSDKDRPIAEIANAVGFSSQSHLTETFRRRLGTTPARWRIET
jgi:AraC family transcriptional regulator